MKKKLLKGGYVVDPTQKINGYYDVLISGDKIEDIQINIEATEDWQVIDVNGYTVMPGLIDAHVHLREPGQEGKESIATGTKAAAYGGFTAVACMPNTTPPIDSKMLVEFVQIKAAKEALTKVYVIGALSKGQEGQELAEIGLMMDQGAIAISDDGRGVPSSGLMLKALKYAHSLDALVISHCEDASLSAGGSMHEGKVSALRGLTGIPSSSEYVMIARDILLAKSVGARLHIAHISTKEGVEMVKEAKTKGVQVTAEVTPHHLVLTDNNIGMYDTNAKMNPPLREEEDRLSLIEGLKDGSIDIIATDHAPHKEEEKNTDFSTAPFGVVGIETSFPVSYTELVDRRGLSLSMLVEAMSCKPAKILGVPGGTLKPGSPADITVVDLKEERIIDKNKLTSRSNNTPFHGMKAKGWPVYTFVDGSLVYDKNQGKLQEGKND